MLSILAWRHSILCSKNLMNNNGWVKDFLEFSLSLFFFLLCNSIAIFSMEGSSPKNVCVLELWFLENSEWNRPECQTIKKGCMYFGNIMWAWLRNSLEKAGCVFWKLVASLLEQCGYLPIMLLHYVVMRYCLIIFCVFSDVVREVAWQNKLSVDLGDFNSIFCCTASPLYDLGQTS